MNTDQGILSEKKIIVSLQNDEVKIRKRLEEKVDAYINDNTGDRFPLLTVLMTYIELQDNVNNTHTRKRRLLGLRLEQDLHLVAKSSDRNKDTIYELLKSVNSAVDSTSSNRSDISNLTVWLIVSLLCGSISLIMNILFMFSN